MGDEGPIDPRAQRLVDEGRKAWPRLRVDPAAFGRFVRERAPAGDDAELCVADLYLACAWLAGDAAAHEALEAGPFRKAAQLLDRFNAPADRLEEAKQSARARLFAIDDGRAALAGYSGRGPLSAWLGIMLARELLQLIRKDRRLRPLETGELLAVVDQSADPETMYFKTLYGDVFRRAFADALLALAPADRRLLRYSIVERLTIDDVSALAGIHRATAARHLAAARQRLLDHARTLMKERLQVDSLELRSILRVCDGELEVSVQRLLGEATGDG